MILRFKFILLFFIAFSSVVYGENLPAERSPLTIAVIGDQQVPIRKKEFYPSFIRQIEWLSENAEAINLRFVTQVGDIIENGHVHEQWKLADAAMAVLDGGINADGKKGIPWNVAYGNHEVNFKEKGSDPSGKKADLFRSYFGGNTISTHRYSNQKSFKGVSSNELNTYHIIQGAGEKSGRQFLMLNLEYDVPGHKKDSKVLEEDRPKFDAIQWAQGVLDQHHKMPTVITTHVFEGKKYGPPNRPYSKGPGRNSQIQIFEKLVRNNPQVFLVLSGHTSEDSHQVKTNDAGYKVLQLVTDYNKVLPHGGGGYMRLIKIDESKETLAVKTFTPGIPQDPEPKYRKGPKSEFTVRFDWNKRFPKE